MSDRLITFFGSHPRPCAYLEGREERNIAAPLSGPEARRIYDSAVRAGFRRSHDVIYRPACSGCDDCRAVRVKVKDFHLRRGFARNARLNSDLSAGTATPQATEENFALFTRYQAARHRDGGMDGMGFDEFRALVEDSPVNTIAAEFRLSDGTLLGTILADRVFDGYSAVYSFFDPDQSRRGLGTYMVLWLIEHTRHQGLAHVYLGYWIAGSPKMTYKARFQPLEALGPRGWDPFDPVHDSTAGKAV